MILEVRATTSRDANDDVFLLFFSHFTVFTSVQHFKMSYLCSNDHLNFVLDEFVPKPGRKS